MPELGRVGMCVPLLRDAGPSPADLEAAEHRVRLGVALPRVRRPRPSSRVETGLGEGSLPCSCPCWVHFPNSLQESDGLLPTKRC